MPDFLLEIGCEEIPARMIDGAREELERRVAGLLDREGLAVAAAKNGGPAAIEAFSTPRRLAVLARDIAGAQADVEEQATGPAVKAAFKDGQPTVAAQKFAEKVGLPLDRLERVSTPKGEYLAARTVKKGRPAAEILSETLPKEIAGLYWGKSMYWRPGRTRERFVRPVRWLVALLDGSAIPLSLFGIEAGDQSRGHRTLGKTVSFRKPGDYSESLHQAAVLASPQEREQTIRKALDAATRAIPGARWREDAPLLNKVVNLTEWPSAIAGGFDPEFLSLPEEVLVTVMRDHQNYFAIQDASGRLAPYFLAVLNTGGDTEGIIRHGHERVLRARFNDARFFWNIDQKVSLPARVEMLKSVTFQKDLGSYYEKAQRVAKLAESLANELKSAGENVDVSAVREAALLSKTDLTTELVKEFTELQGVIGGLYASHQGLGQKIADAIYDQYKPESMEDEVPRTLEGAVLSIADKADSIAGMFALGLIPSGSKDPFALRRQANGIVRIVAEKHLRLSLQELFANSAGNFVWHKPEEKQTAFAGFFRERLEFYLREARGFAYDVVNAVLGAGCDDVMDALARAQAVSEVRGSDDFASIAVSFKRIKNILRQAREGKKRVAESVDASALSEPAERDLYARAAEIAPRVRELASRRKYAEALADVASIRPVVDAFFDKVMVMAEDERVRANRLALLQTLLNEFSTIADFSEMVAEKK
jgi:glycyl-tRNA synthetase beta chain